MPGVKRGRRAIAAVLVAAVLAPATSAPSAAAAGNRRPQTAPTPPSPVDIATLHPIDLPGIDPVLDAIEVDATTATRRADDHLKVKVEDQNRAVLRWLQADRHRIDLVARAGTADRSAVDARARLDLAEADLRAQRGELARRLRNERHRRYLLGVEQDVLRDMAATLIATAPEDQFSILGTMDDITAADRRDAGRDRGVALQSERLEAARRPWASARSARRAQQRRVGRAVAASKRAFNALAAAISERDRFSTLLRQAEEAAAIARDGLDGARIDTQAAIVDRRAARLVAPVSGLDMPLVALNAYWRASWLAPCAIPWWVIAGIGRVETRHGTAFTSRLTAEGDTTVHIIGIPLDGRPGTIPVHDTDGGRLDSDPVWDRAVGPMQFIPGTWARWATDDDASKQADPHNIYDAAGAAAKYLCFSRGDLDTPAKIRGAVLAYNRSDAYANQVLDNANRYHEALDLPDIPPESPRSPESKRGRTG